jgi:hypothetical protein
VATLAVAWRSRLQSAPVAPPVLPVPVVAVAQVHEREESRPDPLPRQADFELSIGLETQSGLERWAPALLLGAQLPVSRRYNFGLTLDVAAPRTAVDTAVQRWTWMQVGVTGGVSRRMVTDNFYVDGQVGLGAGVNLTIDRAPQVRSRLYRWVPPSLVCGMRWSYRHTQGMPWFGITWSLLLDPKPASPIQSTDIPAEPWLLGLAVGGTLGFDGGR